MSGHNIAGKKVAFLLTDGVEQVEPTSPWNAVKDAGGEPTLVAPQKRNASVLQGNRERRDLSHRPLELKEAPPSSDAVRFPLVA